MRAECLCFIYFEFHECLGVTTNAALMSPLNSPSLLCFCLSSTLPCSTEDSQKGERCRVPFLLPSACCSQHPASFLTALFLSLSSPYTSWCQSPCILLICFMTSTVLSYFFFISPPFFFLLFYPFSLQTSGSIFLNFFSSVCSFVCLPLSLVPCLTLGFLPTVLRCFSNFWTLSGAAWLGPSLSCLQSRQ